MNPVTQTLVDQLQDAALIEWVEAWDKIEQVVIRVFRSQAVSRRDEQDFIATKRWLIKRQPDYATALDPYWRAALIKGSGPATHDPFESLLAIEQARDFVGNFEAMKLLPAVRQSINEWLLDTINSGKV
jgi:hypothetical protein